MVHRGFFFGVAVAIAIAVAITVAGAELGGFHVVDLDTDVFDAGFFREFIDKVEGGAVGKALAYHIEGGIGLFHQGHGVGYQPHGRGVDNDIVEMLPQFDEQPFHGFGLEQLGGVGWHGAGGDYKKILILFGGLQDLLQGLATDKVV